MNTITVKPILIESKKRTNLAIVIKKYCDYTINNDDIDVCYKKGTLRKVFANYVNLDYFKCQQLIFISTNLKEEIKIGDIVTDGYDLCQITDLTSKHYFIKLFKSEIKSESRNIELLHGLSKVIATQDQIPESYVQKFIEEYNKGEINNIKIEVISESIRIHEPCIQCGGSGETTFSGTYTTQKSCDLCNQLIYPNTKLIQLPLKPKLIDGFINIKKYLLTSIDGVKMYEGDLFYYTMNKTDIKACKQPTLTNKYYSSKEAANIEIIKQPIFYTEVEVRRLCSRSALLCFSKDNMLEEFDKWFELNKKK